MNSFGERLRELRKRTGLSQAEIAELINQQFRDTRMSQTTLSALEQRVSAPRQEVIEMLAEYYNVPITYFFGSSEGRLLQLIDAYRNQDGITIIEIGLDILRELKHE
jgi:transcriptional regulator with XRE-family HTH domain